MRNKFLTIGLIAVIALSAVGIVAAYSGTAQVVIENVEQFMFQSNEPAGEAMVGGRTASTWRAANLISDGDLTVSGDVTVSGTFMGGGSYYATSSTASAYTILPSEIDDVYLIEWNADLNTTLTLPATTTTGFDSIVGTAAGSNREYMIYAASSTAASTITIAAGTGIDLQEDEGETVIINGLEVARLMLVRKSNSDVIAWLEVGQVGD